MCHPAANSSRQKKYISGIDPVSFYGHTTLEDLGGTTTSNIISLPESHREFCNLFAPSTTWKTFRKQQEVLDFVSSNNCDLFPFVYQTDSGDRLFLAAHPISFWYVDEQKLPIDRHTYEIIREFRPSKLYFDLEFDINVNPGRNGYYMVGIFISFICTALKCKFNRSCDEKSVLNLDSTTANKFSCHLIFPTVIFENNYSVGYFVKQLCLELKMITSGSRNLFLLRDISENQELVENLFVMTDKGQRVLFCDEGVYTKNRHFRLYKSSKYGKNVPFVLSEYNYFPIEGNDKGSREKFVFLSSLITYCVTEISDLLKFEPDVEMLPKMNLKFTQLGTRNDKCLFSSPFHDIDECINHLIFPGYIYKSTFFPVNNIIVYDIIGNRFCHNIGREHKSNNVLYVVNMNSLTYYQKCYDPDCFNFKSESKKLPVTKEIFTHCHTDDELLLAAVDQCEIDMRMNEPSSFTNDTGTHDYNEMNTGKKNDADLTWEDEILIAATEQCELTVSK